MKTITVGSEVMWRGSWGNDAPVETHITFIEQTEHEHEKDGVPVEEVSYVNGEWEFPFICGIGGEQHGHWAYSYQIKPL